MALLRLDTAAITDWPSFHAEWKRLLGFPDFYGANLDAWIDCLSSLRDENAAGLATVVLARDEALLVELPDAEVWRQRVPDIAEALWNCTGFVNRRYVDLEQRPAIALIPVDGQPSRLAT